MLVATDDKQILVTGTAPAPATWLVPGNGQVTPRSVFAHYDGTGAGVAFLPALKVISDAGQTVGIYPCGSSVAAGASADVSWFPRVAANGTGIRYDVDNEGDWLYVGTSSSGGPVGQSIVFNENGFGDIILQAGTSGNPNTPSSVFELDQSGMTLQTFSPANDAMALQFGPHGINWVGTSGSVWNIENDGTGGITLTTGGELLLQTVGLLRIQPVSPTGTLSFFTATGATQQAAPTSTAGIVSALQNYGLFAAGGGPITSVGTISSADGSLTVSNPSGPTTDLKVAAADGGSA